MEQFGDTVVQLALIGAGTSLTYYLPALIVLACRRRPTAKDLSDLIKASRPSRRWLPRAQGNPGPVDPSVPGAPPALPPDPPQ